MLVDGATGAAGSAALQIARHLGARATAVCGEAKAGLARELTAETVLDHAAGPFLGEWNVVLDVAGTLPRPLARELLASGGRLLAVTAGLGPMLGAAMRPRRGGRRCRWARPT